MKRVRDYLTDYLRKHVSMFGRIARFAPLAGRHVPTWGIATPGRPRSLSGALRALWGRSGATFRGYRWGYSVAHTRGALTMPFTGVCSAHSATVRARGGTRCLDSLWALCGALRSPRANLGAGHGATPRASRLPAAVFPPVSLCSDVLVLAVLTDSATATLIDITGLMPPELTVITVTAELFKARAPVRESITHPSIISNSSSVSENSLNIAMSGSSNLLTRVSSQVALGPYGVDRASSGKVKGYILIDAP